MKESEADDLQRPVLRDEDGLESVETPIGPESDGLTHADSDSPRKMVMKASLARYAGLDPGAGLENIGVPPLPSINPKYYQGGRSKVKPNPGSSALIWESTF